MKSSQDPTGLAQQIQALAATVEELTRQNQEMKLLLQQEENRSKGNPEDEGDSQRRGDHQRPVSPDDQNSNLLREMRKEIDDLRSAIKEKTEPSVVDWSEQQIHHSPRQSWNVQYCPNFDCLNLSCLTGSRTLRITLTLSRRCWASNSPLTKYYVAPFPPLSREPRESGSPSCQHCQSIVLSS